MAGRKIFEKGGLPMNILERLFDFLPISSSVLCLITSLISVILTSIIRRRIDNHTDELHIKINEHKMTLQGIEEKELINFLEKCNSGSTKDSLKSNNTN